MAFGSLKKLCAGLVPQPSFRPRGSGVILPRDIVKNPDPSIRFIDGGFPDFKSPDVNYVRFDRPFPGAPPNTRLPSAIQITVRNFSPDASALGTRVDVGWSDIGIGNERINLGSVFVDLARAGFPGSQRTVEIPTPSLSGSGPGSFYGGNPLFVDVIHPYDRDPSNNHCERFVLEYHTSTSGLATSRTLDARCRIHNSTGAASTFQLQVQPTIWGARLEPDSLPIAPGGFGELRLVGDIPSSIPSNPGSPPVQTFNVAVMASGSLFGGVAFDVYVDD